MSRGRLGRPDPLSPEYGAIDPDELDRRIRPRLGPWQMCRGCHLPHDPTAPTSFACRVAWMVKRIRRTVGVRA